MKISIITATRNAAATVADCLASVRRQTHPAIEQIVVDGASTDTTLNIIEGQRSEVRGQRFHKPVTSHQSPVTVVLSEPDRGIYDAMNKGIALATGDVVGILNADDWYADDRVLASVAAVFEEPAVACCYGDLVYVKAGTGDQGPGTGKGWESAVIGETSGYESRVTAATSHQSPVTSHRCCESPVPGPRSPVPVVRYWQAGEFTPGSFYRGWMPPHPTFFVRREVYERYGSFRLDLGSAADYELMLRLLLRERLPAAYIPRVLVAMRTGGASNASLAARLRANRMDRRAWEVNGLTPRPWTIPLKPLRKLSQWLPRGG